MDREPAATDKIVVDCVSFDFRGLLGSPCTEIYGGPLPLIPVVASRSVDPDLA